MLHSHYDSWIDVEKINEDTRFLKSCFRDALIISGDLKLAESIDNPNQVFSKATSIAKAYSLVFQLFNLSEENSAVNYRRTVETDKGITFFPGLFGHAILSLKQHNLSPKEISQRINSLYIEPVLTAHPTEAKRPEVLIQLRELYLLIVQNNITHHTPYEKEILRKQIVNQLLQLWKTSEVFFEKPSVEDELRWVIYYFTNVFPEVIGLMRQRMEQAWKEVFPKDKNTFASHSLLPKFRLSTWVGGDRDGHPMVNYKTTQESLLTLKRKGLQMIQKKIFEVSKKIKIDTFQVGADKQFEKWVQKKVNLLEGKVDFWISKYPHQLVRQALICMTLQIPLDEKGIPLKHINTKIHYSHPNQLIKDLLFIADYLQKKSCNTIADEDILPLVHLVKTFGFHLASLDIRQNSAYHEKAFFQILALTQTKVSEKPTINEKLQLLNEAIKNKNITTAKNFNKLGKEAQEVLKTCQVIAQQIEYNNMESLGYYVVSMTKSVFDLLVLYFFFKESGILQKHKNKWYSPIPIVPLFETIEDLNASYSITEKFIAHPITKESYIVRNKKNNLDQLIMVGYSDSNKDGGIVASLWSLYQTQKKLTQLGKKHKIKFGFFHGIGGSVSRGAGPINRFLRSQAQGSLENFFRITEQGETIVQKYANKLTALFNVEILTAGVLQNSAIFSAKQSQPYDWENGMNIIAEKSRATYRHFLEHPLFIEFFSHVTPIDIIEMSRIGSRPSRRTGKRTLEDLRAIPWVFSWSQNRFFLSGWFGAGTAFEFLEKTQPRLFNLILDSYTEFPPLRYILTNITTSLLRTDNAIMEEYSKLWGEEEKRQQMMKIIFDEKQKAEYYLSMIYKQNIHDRRPRTKIVMQFRHDMLHTLHRIQIVRINKWRNLVKKNELKQAEELMPELLMLVNAIAAGLKTTG